MNTKTKSLPAADLASADYKNLVDLLAVFSEAHNRLDELKTQANRDFLESVDEHKAEYALLQETITKTEAAISATALAHPDWFEVRSSVKTPYGAVKLTTGSSLEVANAEVSIVLIEQEARDNGGFKLDTYVNREPVLNLEALEKLDDSTLARFRIKRVKNQYVKVDPARVDMGKAVKEAVPTSKDE